MRTQLGRGRGKDPLVFLGGRARHGGFSLVELMIAMALFAIVMFVALPTVTGWMRNSQIRAGAESVMGGLQSARAEAVRRNSNVELALTSVAGGGVMTDWRIRCQAATASATCPGVGVGLDGVGVTYIEEGLNTESSPHATVVVTPAATTTIVFNGAGRITPVPAPLADGSAFHVDVAHDSAACLASGGNARCMRLMVAPGGQVRMCDPSLPSTNSRGC